MTRGPKPVPIPDRFWDKVQKGEPDECWPWLRFIDKHGYGRIASADRTSFKAHRLAWELTNGPIPFNEWVLHRCGVRSCCNPSHLYLGDVRDNARDMVDHGRSRRGEASPFVKLTEEQVKEIRSSVEPARALAARYGVIPKTIQRIRNRETWRHL